MDTRSGRIYDGNELLDVLKDYRPGLFEQLFAESQAEREEAVERARQIEAGAIDSNPKVEELLDGLQSGRVVPVSETVVQKVRLGERELNRRERRRQARSKRPPR